MTRKLMAALLGATTLLAACGGGSSDTGATADDGVPLAARAAPEAFTGYLAAQAQDERREPLAMGDLMPPTSETDEPVAVAR